MINIQINKKRFRHQPRCSCENKISSKRLCLERNTRNPERGNLYLVFFGRLVRLSNLRNPTDLSVGGCQESWTDNLSIVTQFSSNFIKLKSGLQGVVLKKEILKEQILTTYFFNEFWKILDESDQNQHEYIVYDLKEFELNEKNCIKY